MRVVSPACNSRPPCKCWRRSFCSWLHCRLNNFEAPRDGFQFQPTSLQAADGVHQGNGAVTTHGSTVAHHVIGYSLAGRLATISSWKLTGTASWRPRSTCGRFTSDFTIMSRQTCRSVLPGMMVLLSTHSCCCSTSLNSSLPSGTSRADSPDSPN